VTDSQHEALLASERQDETADSFLPVPGIPSHITMDRANVEHGLVSLVLTIVELLRQLMERQAIRRVDQGDLTDAQVEQVGSTLMALDGRMSELCDYFEVAREDLNLDLGPLGPLLGRD
jgi:Gas vesicle protein K